MSNSTVAEKQARDTDNMVIDAITSAMKDGDAAVRCLAAKVLGKMRAKGVLEPLSGLLKDPDPDVRCDAAAAIGEIGDRDAASHIVHLLKDEDPFVRISAIRALAVIGDSIAIEPLIKCMISTPDFQYSMGEISGDYRWEIKERAVDALGRIKGKRVVEALIEALQFDEDVDMMLETVLRSLIRSGEMTGIETVSVFLRDYDTPIRRKAARAFTHAEGREAISYIREALTDEDSVVKTNAIEVIGRLGGENEIIPCMLLLKDSDPDVRIKAAEAIVKIGAEKTVSYILPLLKDRAINVRIKVIELLGDAAATDCVEPLISALEDDDERVCRGALLSLSKIGGKEVVPPLILMLKDKGRAKTLRAYVLFAFMKIKTTDCLQAIIEIVKDKGEDAGIRQKAIESMAAFDEKMVIENIPFLLEESDDLIKRGLARILRGFTDSKSVETLLSLLNDENEIVKIEAGISLAYNGNDMGMDILPQSIGYITGLCDAFKNVRTERAQGWLVECLKNENGLIRQSALRAIGHSEDKEAVIPIINMLGEEDEDVRREAVMALGCLSDGRALETLVASLYDHERFANLRSYIAVSLSRIDADESKRLLLDILKDKEKKEYRWIALEALGEIYSSQLWR